MLQVSLRSSMNCAKDYVNIKTNRNSNFVMRLSGVKSSDKMLSALLNFSMSKFKAIRAGRCNDITWCYPASYQVSNNWIAFVSFIVTRVTMNCNHLIDNAHKLLHVALIKDLVESPIAWALLPKCFTKPSICDPCISWWHHA